MHYNDRRNEASLYFCAKIRLSCLAFFWPRNLETLKFWLVKCKQSIYRSLSWFMKFPKWNWIHSIKYGKFDFKVGWEQWISPCSTNRSSRTWCYHPLNTESPCFGDFSSTETQAFKHNHNMECKRSLGERCRTKWKVFSHLRISFAIQLRLIRTLKISLLKCQHKFLKSNRNSQPKYGTGALGHSYGSNSWTERQAANLEKAEYHRLLDRSRCPRVRSHTN